MIKRRKLTQESQGARGDSAAGTRSKCTPRGMTGLVVFMACWRVVAPVSSVRGMRHRDR